MSGVVVVQPAPYVELCAADGTRVRLEANGADDGVTLTVVRSLERVGDVANTTVLALRALLDAYESETKDRA